ncbi:hypothetical protein [Halosegnis sp.]|uniref:DUF7529 family protein n=1 Tax=Halosegnis sp. TaxID=2864959 RepID=UPI0035D452BD
MADGYTTRWDTLVAEMASTAADYRASDYTVATVEPVDVSLVADDGGFVVLASRTDAGSVAELAETYPFTNGERQVVADPGPEVVLVAVVAESADDAAALLIPLHYRRTAGEEGRLRAADGLDVRVRDHAGKELAVLSFADVDPFLPAEPFDAY